MNITISQQKNPNFSELHDLFENAFNEFGDVEKFKENQHQSLDEWFDLKEMEKYLRYGALYEAYSDDTLVGAIFIAQQNPISFPDGNKMEIFILAVSEKYRNQGIATRLMNRAEEFARAHGAKSIVVNTRILMTDAKTMYERFGYQIMGVLKDYYDNGDAVFLQKKLS